MKRKSVVRNRGLGPSLYVARNPYVMAARLRGPLQAPRISNTDIACTQAGSIFLGHQAVLEPFVDLFRTKRYWIS